MKNQWICSAVSIVFLTSGLVRAGQVLEGQLPPAIARLGLQPIGHLAESTRLNLDIALPLRDPRGLARYLQDIYNPGSTNFHHYLKPEEFTRRFGATTADYDAVIAFASKHGLTVTARHPNRMLVDVSGTAATVEKAFQVNLLTYHHPTEDRNFYAPDKDPTLDLTVPVLRVGGLDNYGLPRPLVQVESNSLAGDTGSATNGWYMGDDFREAYASNVTWTGQGQIIGLLEFDGFYTNDIAEYESQAGMTNVTVTRVLLDGYNGVPENYDAVIEVSLDIEDAISMAPGVSGVLVYEAGENGNWHDMLNRMADDDLAAQMSSSWYIREGEPDPVASQIFQQMQAQGQSFFQASGDSLAYTGLIPFPCDNPYITLVGGTELYTTEPDGPWESETVWNVDGGGSGGGVSTSYPIPSWQQGVSMADNQGSTNMRNVPDVALTAYNVYVVADNGTEFGVSGTSCAAPLWAGFTALVNQQAAAYGQQSVGFLNPAIYAIGLGTNYDAAFNDIVIGNNTNRESGGRFLAEPGYDLCTGWGTPTGQGLINTLTAPLEPGPPSIVVQPQSQTIPYGSNVELDVEATGSFPITFQWSFDGTNMANATNAWLAFTYCTSAQSGTYMVLVSNSLGVVPSSNAVLAVEPPVPPVITSQPEGLTLPAGATAAFSVAASGTLPLFYQWTLNGSNVTDATNSSLTLSNVPVAEAGAYVVEVTNVAGATNSDDAWLVLTPGWEAASSAPSVAWSAVASSSDGSKLAATVNGGSIYTSTNSGAAWTESPAPGENWTCIASSASGAVLVAAVDDGGIFVSTNGGSTWKETSAGITNEWCSLACESNGVRMFALKRESGIEAGSTPIFISTNTGSTWEGVTVANYSCPRVWSSIACSANATIAAATVDNGPIYVSTNSGSNWTKTTAVSNAWNSIACSANGTVLVAVAHTGEVHCDQIESNATYNGPIFTSTDTGQTWTEISAPTNNWYAVACSASGAMMVAVASNGPIYLSTNFGVTWANTGAPSNSWNSIAASADGTHWVAAGGSSSDPGQIYTWQASLNLELTSYSTTNGLVFSWPSYWSGAVLMQTTNLAAGNWAPAGGQVTETNGQIQATIPNSSGSYFYRLNYP